MARVLILGGVGVVGRNLVKYLVDNDHAEFIRVVDKRIPIMAFLSPDHKAALEDSRVEFQTGDLTDPETVRASFDGEFHFVFNLAAETKHGRDVEWYEHTVTIARNCGEMAREKGVRKFIQVSTAAVYKGSKKGAARENAELDPWGQVAEYHHRAEEALRGIDGLPLVIARPAVIYGPGDERGLMPRCVCAIAYKQEDSTMKFLWSKDLKHATVHVFDVCRALWLLANRAEPGPDAIYNLADPGDTDQNRIAEVLAEVFGIRTGFHGTLISTAASAMMGSAVDEANETHMGPWMATLKENGIKRTSLSPFIHEDLMRNRHLNVDGSRICEELGFTYRVPALSAAAVRDMVGRAVVQGIFPAHVRGESLGLGDNPSRGGGGGGGGGGAAGGGGGR